MELKKVVSNKCKSKILNSQQKLSGWLSSRGITNRELAGCLKISDAFVGHILNGHRGIPYKRWVQMVELGIPIEMLPVPNKPRKGDVVVDVNEIIKRVNQQC